MKIVISNGVLEFDALQVNEVLRVDTSAGIVRELIIQTNATLEELDDLLSVPITKVEVCNGAHVLLTATTYTVLTSITRSIIDGGATLGTTFVNLRRP